MIRVAFAFVAIFMSTEVLAGAWTLNRGETRTYSTTSFSYGKFAFDEDGNLVEVPEYKKYTFDGALEYGILDWLTGIARGELREETSYGEIYRDRFNDPIFREGETGPRIIFGERTDTYGAIEGGARLRLLKGDLYVSSVEAVVGSGSFDSNLTVNQSDGPFVEARALFGIGGPVWGQHTFFDAQAGYRARFDRDESDEVVLDLTVGVHLHPRWLLLGQTFSTFDVSGESHYTKAGGSVVYGINDRLKLEVGGLATVYGRNAIQELGGKVGFWWSY